MYNYAIIGAGPTGLTLAYYLAKYISVESGKIIVIDREASIGGCHRVRRYGKDELFTEHGPRIIIENYFCLKNLLKEFGFDFYDLFTPYNFSTNSSAAELFATLTFREIFSLVSAFLKFMVTEDFSRHVTMLEFSNYHEFSEKSKLFVDKLCRLSDGGTIENYTLYEFLQIFNQNFFYTVYQPKLPNDKCLFKIWEDALLSKNVEILLNSEITSFTEKGLVTNGKIISAKNYIFTIPPKPMVNLLKNSFNPNMFGDFNKLSNFANVTNYLVYIPIIFHWDVDLENILVPEKHAGPESSYGIVFVIMSKYMKFTNPLSKTVIVCTIKNAEQKSPRNGKTANECSEQELIAEVFLQLREQQPGMINAPYPTRSILDPGIYFNENTKKYDTLDTAFFLTKDGYWPMIESIYEDCSFNYKAIAWVGTHNGNSSYSFTSMESAMQNAIYYLNAKYKMKIELNEPFTVKKALWIIIILLLIILIYSKSKRFFSK